MTEWTWNILREVLGFGEFSSRYFLDCWLYSVCSIPCFPSLWNACIFPPCLLPFLAQVCIFAEKQRAMRGQLERFSQNVGQRDNRCSVSIQSFGSVVAIVFSSWGLKDSRKYSSIFPFLVKKQATFPHNIYSAFIVIISNNYFFLLAHCFSSIAICSCFNTTGFSQLSLMLWIFSLSSLISALFFFWEFDMISQIYSLPWSSDTFHIICVLCLLMAMNDGLTSHCS